MAYQETNDILNESVMTADDMVAQRDGLVERKHLRESGRLQKIADAIRKKPRAEKPTT